MSATTASFESATPVEALTHQKDLVVAAPPIARVLRETPTFASVCSRFVHHLEFPELAERLSKLSGGPRSARFATDGIRTLLHQHRPWVDNPFCDAKSALKFHEAALVNVPTIASPTSPFVESIVEELAPTRDETEG